MLQTRKFSAPFLSRLALGATIILCFAGCNERTHVTGRVRNRWGSPVFSATVTLRQGTRTKQMKTAADGSFDLTLDHPRFETQLELTATSEIYQTTQKLFSSHDHPETIDMVMQEKPEPTLGEIRKSRLKGITAAEAKPLAEQICLQLPNVSGFALKSSLSGDDVHDTLVLLSKVALPCLVDHLTDDAWMPDSRSEPLADFHAGDAALWILTDAGLDFDKVVSPLLDREKQESVGVYEYFDWVNRPGHRRIVQNAVKQWLQENPECCGSESDFASSPTPAPALDTQRIADLKRALVQMKPGMDANAARKLLGSPDAEADAETVDGIVDLNRFERSAAFYFLQSRTTGDAKPDFKQRDFLRDRYVIIFYGENGKFIRAFSNVPGLSPVFPTSERLWQKMIYASMSSWQKRSP